MTYNKEEIFNLLSKFNFGFGFDDSRMDELAAYLASQKFLFTYDFGVTKAVIIPKGADYVIKIPFEGYYNLSNHFYNFTEANDKDGWDYCREEADRYKFLSDNPLKECFAETYFLGYIDHYPIYIQEKCSPFNYNKNSKTKEEKKMIQPYLRHYTSRGVDLNTNWCIDFRNYYGEELFNYFLYFIDRYKWGDDLSSDNVGYKCGRPVVIDFAGFRDQEEDQDEILDTISQEF